MAFRDIKRNIKKIGTVFLVVLAHHCVTQALLVEKIDTKKSSNKKWTPWSLSGFSLASIDLPEAHGASGGSIFTYNYLGLNYYLGDGKKISLRPAFLYNTAGYNNRGQLVSQEVKLHDIYINYAHYNAFLLPGNVGLSMQYRFYLPTGESAKTSKRIGTLGGIFSFTKPVSSVSDLSYHVKPKYFFNTNTTYLRTFDDGGTSIRQNKQGQLEQYIEYAYRFNEKFGVQTSLKHNYTAYLPSKAENKEYFYRDDASLALAVDYKANDVVRFIFSVEQSRNIKNPRTDFKLFRREEMSYVLLTFMRLGYLGG